MEDFIKKVAEMRSEQKNYFRYRTPDHLKAAKKLESEVDAKIQRLTGSKTGNVKEQEEPTLF